MEGRRSIPEADGYLPQGSRRAGDRSRRAPAGRLIERRHLSSDARPAGATRSSLPPETTFSTRSRSVMVWSAARSGRPRSAAAGSTQGGATAGACGRSVRHRRRPKAIATAAIEFASRRSPVRDRLAPSRITRLGTEPRVPATSRERRSAAPVPSVRPQPLGSQPWRTRSTGVRPRCTRGS